MFKKLKKESKDKSLEPLNQFVDRLVEEKNIQGVDDEIMEQIKDDLMDRVENKINALILQKMPANKLDEFEALLDAKANPKKVQEFCQNNIPDLDQVIAAGLLEFRDIYLNA